MTTLFIQIPCHNESASLPATLAELPRSLPGVERIRVLVIDDGSTDGTEDVARRHGAEVLRLQSRQGLARGFTQGLDYCLRGGADVIVNTDGDNQYVSAGIVDLVTPILERRADVVVGDRLPGRLLHFSPLKRVLSGVGSWTVSVAAGAVIPDSASGFRAFSRDAALRLFVGNDFTYTHETLIQASRRRMSVVHVPVEVRSTERRSRLARSTASYVANSAATILRAYAMYKPLHVFVGLGALAGSLGLALCIRFVWFYVSEGGQGHVQSLLLAVLLLVVAFGALMLGVLADLVAGNRRLLEELVWRVRAVELRRARSELDPPDLGEGAKAQPATRGEHEQPLEARQHPRG